MIGVIIGVVAMLLLIGFLFAPIVVYIDTEQNRYAVFQFPVLSFFLQVDRHALTPRFRLLGINIPLRKKERSKSEIRKKKEKKSRYKKSIHAWRFLMERILQSFTIKRVVLDLDTDDVILNAQLVPLFLYASGGARKLSTNFNGRAYLHLHLLNRPSRLLWIFIQFLTKK